MTPANPQKRPSLRARLLAGETSIGPFLKFPAPEVTEVVGLAGFDHVVIDLEHSAFTLATAVDIVRGADARGIDAVIRTPDNTATEISRALDTGASGIIVPHIGSARDARDAVSYARFHPLGERGMDIFARAAGWGAMPRDEYFRHANEEITLAVMVEGRAVIEDLESIASIEGLDLLFVGPYDLSQSLGHPGQIDHPEVIAAIESAARTAAEHNRALGMYVDSVAMAQRFQDVGVRFIGLSNDADLFRRHLGDLLREFRGTSS